MSQAIALRVQLLHQVSNYDPNCLSHSLIVRCCFEVFFFTENLLQRFAMPSMLLILAQRDEVYLELVCDRALLISTCMRVRAIACKC